MSGSGMAAPGSLPTPPSAVLFDLDDTLYPERLFVDGGFGAVARYLAPLVGEPADGLRRRLWELHTRDGRGQLFNSLLAEHGVTNDPDLVLACLLAYRNHQARLEPFAGVPALLDSLQAADIPTGVISDGNAAVQSRKLSALWPGRGPFRVVVLTDELGPTYAKPSPVPFRVACRLVRAAPSEAVYVGNDPRKDFQGARTAGLATIRIGSLPDEGGPQGGGRRSTLDNSSAGIDDADRAVDSFSSLLTVLSATAPVAKTRRLTR